MNEVQEDQNAPGDVGKVSDQNTPNFNPKKHSHKTTESKESSRYRRWRYFYRRLHDRCYFIVLMILINSGFGNLYNFPKLVNKHGGIIFLFIHLFILILLIIPVYLIEIGIAQFYSKTAVTMFRIVPILQGLGWSALISCIFTLTSYVTKISWTVLYLMYSFLTDLPWLHCESSYKYVTCINKTFNFSRGGKPKNFASSGELFFEVKIEGSRSPIDGHKYTFNDGIGGINVFALGAILITWMLIICISWLIQQRFFKFIYFNFFFSAILFVIILVRSICLPGSVLGLIEFFSLKSGHSLTMESFKDALVFGVYSTTVACSVIPAIASRNKFHYNFHRASYIIVMSDFCLSFFSGIIQFSVLGYMFHTKSIDDISLFLSKQGMQFYTFTEGTKNIHDARFMNIIYMLMMLMQALFTIAAVVMSLVLSIMDNFPNIYRGFKFKELYILLTVSCFQCILSLFFVFRGTCLYEETFTAQISTISTPLVLGIEVIIVHFIYGTTRFRFEVKMMLGFSYNFIFMIISNLLIPLLMVFILSTLAFEKKDEKPLWASFVTHVLSSTCLMPLILFAFREICRSYRTYRGFDIITHSFSTPKILGPCHKRYWLLNKFYQQKLQDLRENPEFLETFGESEDINELLAEMNSFQSEGKSEKRKSLTFSLDIKK